jgi:hypothetical protein
VEPAPDRIGRLLEELGAETDRTGERAWFVRLPSVKRGTLAAGLVCGDRTLTLQAFFMRRPDRDHAQVYERLLRKNLGLYAWRFALDEAGDLFLTAQVDLDGVDADALDRLLGTLTTYVDETWEGVLRLGFDVPEGTALGPPPGG